MPGSRYSAWLALFDDVVGQLPREEQRQHVGRLEAGPVADRRAIADRLRSLNPTVSRASWETYDQYLKAQGVREGVQSYRRVVQLLLGSTMGSGLINESATKYAEAAKSPGPVMHTRVVSVDPRTPDPQAIADAAATLARGGLVAFPTETVYGLGANALDADAVAGIFRAKGRPATDPLIVHLARAAQLNDVARDVPAIAMELARAFWPGALTLILSKRAAIPDAVTAGLPTVAVRVPAHPVAHALLERAAIPIAAPSANLFSRPSPTTADHVRADLDGRIDLIVDGGPATIGVESTILDLTINPPLLRRPGGVSLAALRALIPDVQSREERLSAAQAQPAPGQLLRHYAPQAKLTLYLGAVDAVSERLARDARTAAAGGSRVGILAPEEDLIALAPRLAAVAASGRVLTERYGARRDQDGSARDLFRALRDLDARAVDVMLASAPDAEDLWAAIVDRLSRAAEGRVVRVGLGRVGQVGLVGRVGRVGLVGESAE